MEFLYKLLKKILSSIFYFALLHMYVQYNIYIQKVIWQKCKANTTNVKANAQSWSEIALSRG